MPVTVEDLSSVKKILHIEIPENDTVRELDNAYNTLRKNAKIKGFRPGKAPRSVLERMFKKDVHADVTSRLIQESFMNAVKETDLKIVGTPQIDPPELTAKGPYKYDATVEIKPDIEAIDFKGLSLKKTRYQVRDEEIQAQLKCCRKIWPGKKISKKIEKLKRKTLFWSIMRGSKTESPLPKPREPRTLRSR